MPDRISRSRARRPQDPAREPVRGAVAARPEPPVQEAASGDGSGFHPMVYFTIILVIALIGVGVYFALITRGFTGFLGNSGGAGAIMAGAAVSPSPEASETPTPPPTPSPTPMPTPTPDATLTVSAVGDIMVHTQELTATYDKTAKEYDFTKLFAPVKDVLSAADLTLGNLETTISANGKYSGYPTFSSPESLITGLKESGFDVITTSNNHSYDKGYAGVEKTIKTLDDAGLAHTGTFLSQEEYHTPLVVDAAGMKVAVLAYTYGLNTKAGVSATQDRYAIKGLNMDTVKADIDAARSAGADVVIVSVHWGTENTSAPSAEMESQAKTMLENGADLILGSHPHVLQPIKRVTVTRADGTEYEGVVAYSMGNFVAAQNDKYTDTGLIFNITFRKSATTGKVTIDSASYVPTLIAKSDGYQVLPIGQYMDDETLLNEVSASTRKRLPDAWQEATDLIGSDAATAVR